MPRNIELKLLVDSRDALLPVAQALCGLGDFLELEVVLREGESDSDGAAEAQRLLQALGLARAPQEASTYLGLPGRQPA